jgi:hypothetical protein
LPISSAGDLDPESSVSIFRDDRRGRGDVEFVAEADLHAVLDEVGVHSRAEDVAVEPGEGIDEDIVARSEVGIAIFGPDRPIVCDGVFEAAADGPADAGIREAVPAEEGRVEQGVGVGGRNAGVETAESDAARGVDEDGSKA